jgi:hypothetical protein
MQKLNICLIMLLLFTFFSCRKKQAETETVTSKPDETSASAQSMPSFDNDYLVSIYEAQELIKIQQDDTDLRRTYCEKAYLPDKKLFISMGIARLHRPDNGAAIPDQMAERAARLDAIRWASYGREWLKNNYEPPFGKLTTSFQQDIEVINKAHVGDSLFVFAATRIP